MIQAHSCVNWLYHFAWNCIIEQQRKKLGRILNLSALHCIRKSSWFILRHTYLTYICARCVPCDTGTPNASSMKYLMVSSCAHKIFNHRWETVGKNRGLHLLWMLWSRSMECVVCTYSRRILTCSTSCARSMVAFISARSNEYGKNHPP